MLWIVGTSVSIEAGGYAPRLTARVHSERGIASRNLSIGDQTSLMGAMRVLEHLDEFAAGDVAVWEYSLLDSLLVDACFNAADTHAARRLAWRLLAERGVTVIVLMTPPRCAVDKRSPCEQGIAEDARAFGFSCMDMRDVFRDLGIAAPAEHYRDDRHPRADSPLLAAVVDRLVAFVLAHHGHTGGRAPTLPPPGDEREWRWLGADALAALAGLRLRTWSNALLNVPAVELAVDDVIPVPPAKRVVGLGVLSTHASGGAWCRHPGCAPAATRLPDSLDYEFLLRATGLPCVRSAVDRIASAPTWAYQRGLWAAYGQDLSDRPGPVAVFGLLYVPLGAADPALAPRRRPSLLARWMHRGDRSA